MMKEINPSVPLTKEEKQKLIRDTVESEYKQKWFKIGDVITINGIRYRVKGIKPTELRLKMLPKIREE